MSKDGVDNYPTLSGQPPVASSDSAGEGGVLCAAAELAWFSAVCVSVRFGYTQAAAGSGQFFFLACVSSSVCVFCWRVCYPHA